MHGFTCSVEGWGVNTGKIIHLLIFREELSRWKYP